MSNVPSETYGGTLNVVKTDRLLVRYAQLPVTTTSLDFMWQLQEPYQLVPQTQRVSFMMSMLKTDVLDILSGCILQKWKEMLEPVRGDQATIPAEIQWMYDISLVELVESELLVPKAGPGKVYTLPKYDLLRVKVREANGGTQVGYIGTHTWEDIQRVLRGEKLYDNEFYQFNVALGTGPYGEENYIRCAVSQLHGSNVELYPYSTVTPAETREQP